MARFTFKKHERLSSLKAIDQLYESGQSFYAGGFRCIFILTEEKQSSPCQVVFSVPKKSFAKAVDRNLLKRRMRESYRLNKQFLYEVLNEKQKNMHLLIQYSTKEIRSQREITEGVVNLLKSLLRKIAN